MLLVSSLWNVVPQQQLLVFIGPCGKKCSALGLLHRDVLLPQQESCNACITSSIFIFTWLVATLLSGRKVDGGRLCEPLHGTEGSLKGDLNSVQSLCYANEGKAG